MNLLPMLAGYVVLLALAQVGVIGLGLARIPLTMFAAWTVLLGAGGGGLAAGRKLAQGQSAVAAREDGSGAGPVRLWAWSPLGLGVALVGLILWLACHVPDLSFDGIMYHTPPVHFWAFKGYLHWIDPAWINSGTRLEPLMNGYPKGVEALAFLLVKLTGQSEMVHTANVFFLLLGLLAISQLALRLGAAPMMALAVGALWPLIPVNLNQAFTTLVDGSYGAAVAAFLALFWEYLRGQGVSGDQESLSASTPLCAALLAATCGAALGVMMGIKPTGVPITVLGLGLMTLSTLGQVRRKRESPWRGLFLLTVVALSAALVGGYWYLRNWYYAGNPLYPLEVKLGRHVLFPGWPVEEMLGTYSNTPPELRPLSAGMKVLMNWCQIGRPGLRWPRAIAAPEARFGGLGWIWLVGGLPAIPLALIALYRKRRASAALLSRGLIFIGAAFILQPMNWWARYTVWLHALGLPCFALLAGILFQGHCASSPMKTRWPRLWGRIWVLACLGLVLMEAPLALRGWFPTYLVRHPHRHLSKQCLAQPWRWKLTQGWGAAGDLKGTLAESVFADHEPVAFTPMHFHPGKPEFIMMTGFVCLPIGARTIHANIDPNNLKQLEGLRALKVRYLFWDEDYPLTEAARKALNIKHASHAPGIYILELNK